MLKKIFTGASSGQYWILSGEIPAGGGLSDANAFSYPMFSTDDNIFSAGARGPSTDGTVLCLDNRGKTIWSKAVTATLVSGPPASGQFSGMGGDSDGTYVIAVHTVRDENLSQGETGVVQCRTVDDGTLVWQKDIENARCTHVCAANGQGYIGLSEGTDHQFNYAKATLSSGSITGNNRVFTPGGNPMRMVSVSGSSVYALTTDVSVTGGLDDNTQIVKLNTSGVVSSSVKIADGFVESSYINSTKADLAVRRSGSTDYVYLFGVDAAEENVYVIKFSSINGASSTIDWQKKITRSGWSPQDGRLAGTVDSNGNVYVTTVFREDAGARPYEALLFKLDDSDGSFSKSIIVQNSAISVRAMASQNNAVLLHTGDILRLPLDLEVTNSPGAYLFTDTTDYTVATSSITISAGTVSSSADSYSFSTSSYGDSNSGDETSIETLIT